MRLRATIVSKLLLSAFALIAVTLLLVDFYLTRYIAERERNAVTEQLTSTAHILAGELDGVEPGALEKWAVKAHERTKARVTVIDASGAVLADSDRHPDRMENHGSRPEVREARAGRAGNAVRYSATLGAMLSYVALPVDYRGRPGAVIRLSLPLHQIDLAVATVRGRIIVASAVAALIALAMAWFFSRSFSYRIHRLQAFAADLPSGRAPLNLAEFDDELGALARSLIVAGKQLTGLLDRVNLESERRQAILSGMAEGVLAIDNELRVTFCNQAFAVAAGARQPVPEGVRLPELIKDDAFVATLARVVVTGQSIRDRIQLASSPGRWYDFQAGPMSLRALRGAIAIVHDITELERLERIRKDFVANVSHELRTPLTAIRGCAETLLDGALDDSGNNRRFVEIIRTHSIRLNNIASDLLVLSELESPQAGAQTEPVSVRDALEAALDAVEPAARSHEVSVRSGSLEEVKVMGNRTRLEQALVNLIDNAVKFNRPGGGVSAECRLDGRMVRVTIRDTGIGIPAEDLPRIFERFYRVDKARSREAGGTGLGLSIVKHVIERMNGTIRVESKLGEGSVFTVELPVA